MDQLVEKIRIIEIGADLAGKLAWPIAVVWIAWCFRSEVRDLTARLSSAALGDKFVVNFSDRLTQAKAQASDLREEGPIPSTAIITDNSPEGRTPPNVVRPSAVPVDGTPLSQLISPPQRVVNAWDDVYRHLSRLYKQVADGGEPREMTLLFTALYRANCLTSEQVALAKNLYAMRNYALSPEGKNINPEAAAEYEGVSQAFCLSLR
jgi:hypothetical protein